MIKGNVNVCAIINRAASVKNGKDGLEYLSFGVKLPISGRSGEVKELEIAVTLDSDKAKVKDLAEGKRVKLVGVLALHKSNDEVHFYLRAESVEKVKTTEADSIAGAMDFRGKLGKKGYETKTDKNGYTYLSFGAFSCDKPKADTVEFTWVRFLWFHPAEDVSFLKPGGYVEVSGELQLGVYNGALTIDCLVNEAHQWVLQKKEEA